jgi:protoporphyrinogen oxidase
VPYIGVVCTSVLLARPLSGAYLTYIADPTLPLTAVVEMTALVDHTELGGNHLIYLPRYVGTAGEGLNEPEDQVARQSINGLLRIYPDLRESDIRAVRIARAKYVLPVPTVGRRGRLPVTTSIPYLYLVNSSQIVNGTLNLNETIRLADEASAVLLRATPDTRMEAAE